MIKRIRRTYKKTIAFGGEIFLVLDLVITKPRRLMMWIMFRFRVQRISFHSNLYEVGRLTDSKLHGV